MQSTTTGSTHEQACELLKAAGKEHVWGRKLKLCLFVFQYFNQIIEQQRRNSIENDLCPIESPLYVRDSINDVYGTSDSHKQTLLVNKNA